MSLVDQVGLLITRIGTELKSVRSALSVKASGFGADDFGWIAWTTDPANASASTPIAGRVYTARVKVAKTGTISNLSIWVSTAGATLTHGFLGIYKLDGTLLAQSADQTTNWQTTGLKTVPMVTPITVNAGDQLLFAYLVAGTTAPAIAANASAPAVNSMLTATSGNNTYRAGIQSATAQVALPSPAIMTAQGLNSNLPCIVAT